MSKPFKLVFLMSFFGAVTIAGETPPAPSPPHPFHNGQVAVMEAGQPLTQTRDVQGEKNLVSGGGKKNLTQRTAKQQSNDLIGYWPFDEGSGSVAIDHSSSGNDGAVVGAQWVNGKLGKALAFDGENDYVILAKQPTLSDGFTFTAWVKRAGDLPAKQDIFNNNQFFIRTQPELENTENPYEAFIKLDDSSVEPRANSGVPATINAWHFIAVTWDKTDLQIYVNAERKGTSRRAGSLTPTLAQAEIGRGEQTDLGNPFNGLIDEVRIYSRALPVAEINQLYQQEAAPTLIFHNGQVVTMEANQPRVQALAVQGEKILAVGSDEAILALRTAETQLIDLAGKTLLPGFVDAHSHIFNDAQRHIFPDAQNYQAALAQAQQLALRNGITTVGDPYIDPHDLEEMKAFSESGELLVRTRLYLIYDTNCGNIVGDWYHQYHPGQQLGSRLQIGGVKIFADGGTCGAPAISTESGGAGGDLFFTQSQLNQVVSEAQATGFQVAIHALGDRAVEQAQNAIAFALGGKPNGLRLRIDHNAIIRPDMLKRYGEIGIVAVIFGHYPTCLLVDEGLGPSRWPWVWPWRDLLDSNPGLHIAWHSDIPYFPSNPLLHLYNLGLS